MSDPRLRYNFTAPRFGVELPKKTRASVYPEFLTLCVLALPFSRFFVLLSRRSTRRDAIPRDQPEDKAQKKLTFELPPLKITEQRDIVRRVEALFAYADRLETRYSAAALRSNA